MTLSKGQVTLAILVAITIVMVEVGGLISTISVSHFYNKRDSIFATQALNLVDSGLEEAMYRMSTNVNYPGGTLTLPNGQVVISVATPSALSRVITVTTQGTPVRRTVSANITLTPATENPLKEYGVFGGNDVRTNGSNSLFRGPFRGNDNLWIEGNSIVEGNAYLSGDGTSANSRVRNNAILRDDPTTPEIEGNMYSVDDIYVESNGQIQGDAVSKKRVRLFQSGSVGGSIIEDPTLTLPAVPIPQFDFDYYKQLAQTNGTFYTSPAQFLSFLNLSGGVISGGVHYIQTNQTLTLPLGGNVNITGTIISDNNISIRSTNYVHRPQGDIPVLVSKRDITIDGNTSCACRADIEGGIFAMRNFTANRPSYTGAGYAVEIEGVIWAGNIATVSNNTFFQYSEPIAGALGGFNYGEGGGGTDTYFVEISSWSIN